MSMDDLKAIQRATIDRITEEFEEMNENIDTNQDGDVSVREALAMTKSILTAVRDVIKEVF